MLVLPTADTIHTLVLLEDLERPKFRRNDIASIESAREVMLTLESVVGVWILPPTLFPARRAVNGDRGKSFGDPRPGHIGMNFAVDSQY